MYYKKNGELLKTKIIATIGKDGRELYDVSSKPIKNVSYDELFKMFLQHEKSSSFMVDVIRLNMSFHVDEKGHEECKRVFDWIRKNKHMSKDVAILADLPGAKTRLGLAAEGTIEVAANTHFNLHFTKNSHDIQNGAYVMAYGEPLNKLRTYRDIKKRLIQALSDSKASEGITISIGDGGVVLKAIKEDNREDDNILHCEVSKAGVLSNNKGVTFEGLDLGLPSFEKQDKEALKFLLDLDNGDGILAYIAVSFVRHPKDILDVRHFVENHYLKFCKEPGQARVCCPEIIAKIETEQGKNKVEDILDVADGIMVARGDLALQINLFDVPGAQKDIISLCNRRGKTAITATEMLASMESNPKPTRAEANDVFNAVLDGTDAVMLSGETATGVYPAHAITYMAKICEEAEKYYEKIYRRGSPLNTERMELLRRGSELLLAETNRRIEEARRYFLTLNDSTGFGAWATSFYDEKLTRNLLQNTTDRICHAGCEIVEETRFETIFASTLSGRTARMVCRFRPSARVLGIVHDEINRRKLLISYGVYPINVGRNCSCTEKEFTNNDEIFTIACKYGTDLGMVNKDSDVVFICGAPLFHCGVVNQIQIKKVV
jgi:pyruvate kinase